jgi:hypothetical protein
MSCGVTCGVAAEGGSGGWHPAWRRRKVSGGARCHAVQEKKQGRWSPGVWAAMATRPEWAARKHNVVFYFFKIIQTDLN